MQIEVEHCDSIGKISNKTINLSKLALIKHLSLAGQNYAPRTQKLLRTIGMLLHYSYYMQSDSFSNNKFSLPPKELYDPTEKGQFSNLVGKAIADFLSKRIDNSRFTVNYEAEMRRRCMPIKSNRPDLIAFTNHSSFAIEAKGFSGHHGNMLKHKTQSRTGGIPVNFTIACVSFNLYNQVKCKYFDPSNEKHSNDIGALRDLTKDYFSGLVGFLNEKLFSYQETDINGEKFYEVELSFRKYEKSTLRAFFPTPFLIYELFDFYRPRLLLPKEIYEYSKYGIPDEFKPFIYEDLYNENISFKENQVYVDNDRVGLKIGQ
jgi:hypothetical protein